MPVYEGGAGVPTPAGVDMVAGWIAPPEDEDDGAAEPEAPAPKSRPKKAAAGA